MKSYNKFWKAYTTIINESKFVEIHIDDLYYLKSIGFFEETDENGNITFKKGLSDGSYISIVWDPETMNGEWRALLIKDNSSEKCIDVGSNAKLKKENFMKALFEKEFPEVLESDEIVTESSGDVDEDLLI